MSRVHTYHCHQGADRDLTARHVPKACLAVGDDAGHCLTAVGIAQENAPWALATCVIQFIGKYADSSKGDARRSVNLIIDRGQCRGFRTKLVTRGVAPSIAFSRAPNGNTAWSDSFQGANDILGCFGLTVDDLIDYYGNVEPDERMVFDLATIIETLAPEILSDSTRAARRSA